MDLGREIEGKCERERFNKERNRTLPYHQPHRIRLEIGAKTKVLSVLSGYHCWQQATTEQEETQNIFDRLQTIVWCGFEFDLHLRNCTYKIGL